jgi:signal transduction histidine kinase
VRLADFIEKNTEAILAEWVTFAATSGPAGETMDLAALRDHALEMLKIIIGDLRTPQTKAEQTEKSKGASDSAPETPDTPAEVHGAGRAASGFTIGEMVSEYRALRASVIRLWTKMCGTLTGTDLEDLMRFNEAIDQATAESITRFTHELDQSKEMFIAILGHDLRTPLGAVSMASQFMLDTGELKEPHLTLTTRILRSATRMNRMVGDLLDFTRSRLGSGMPIVRREMDMAIAARHAVEEVLDAQPGCVIQLDTSGDVLGEWDAARVGQVLTNLLANAVEYGTAKAPISVTVTGEAKEVVLRVHNRGAAILASDVPGLFNPLKRLVAGDAAASDSSSLGLGLYIAERIVSAHGGTIDVESSSEAGTSFTIRFPRFENRISASRVDGARNDDTAFAALAPSGVQVSGRGTS